MTQQSDEDEQENPGFLVPVFQAFATCHGPFCYNLNSYSLCRGPMGLSLLARATHDMMNPF